MARRTKEELLIEFHRLYDVFETSCRIKNELLPDGFPLDDIPSREDMLAIVDRKEATLSQLLSGTREALNDDFEMFQFGSKQQSADEAELSQRFLSRYQEITGRDYFADAGRADCVAKAILKRGILRSNEEARLLNIFVSDTAQGALDADEIAKATKLMHDYETAK